MNGSKYRKLYLQENWGENVFSHVKYCESYSEEHPRIVSGECFWLNSTELCIGYILSSKPSIFRPVFQFRRQHQLDMVHAETHMKFWYNVYIKYMLCLPKRIPFECTKYICNMLYAKFKF